MKKFTKVLVSLLSLALMLSVSIGALATAPSGYTTSTFADSYSGKFVGKDTTTGAYWLLDGAYEGGEIDQDRKYGKVAYLLPMSNPSSLLKLNNAHPLRPGSKTDEINYSDRNQWPSSYARNVKLYDDAQGYDDAVVQDFTYFSYANTAIIDSGQSLAGLKTTGVGVQIPELKPGSLDTILLSPSSLSGDYGVIMSFDIAEEYEKNTYVFTTYFYGPLESYRTLIFSGANNINKNTYKAASASYAGEYTYQAQNVISDINKGILTPDAYVDTVNYEAETGIYLSFEVKGDFTVVVGCMPDYTRQTSYGSNANIEGFFFDEYVEEDPDTPVISSVYTKMDRREVSLQWSTSDTNTETIILRKLSSSSADSWAPLVEVPKGIVSYVDKTADSASEYDYAIVSRKLGQYTRPKQLSETFETGSDYHTTTIKLGRDSYTAKVGDTLEITAVLTDTTTSQPIEGEEVYLRLDDLRYVGKFIEDITYTAKTNSAGIATFTVPCKYANQVGNVGAYGSYIATIYTEYNDVKLYQKASTSTLVTIMASDRLDTTTPVVLQLSDEIKPGDVLNISGSNLDKALGLSVYATPSVEDPYFDINNAIAFTEILQYDLYGTYINVKVPEDMPAGIYDIWVATVAGQISAPNGRDSKLNMPRLYWINEISAFEGLTIRAIGINFMAEEFGLEGADTLVRLTNAKGESYLMPVVDVNPYMVEFMINDIPVGTYDVQVSPDGVHWSNTPWDQQLEIVLVGNGDPLGLGVAWANKFNYTRVFDVTDYGAISDDDKDDTYAFWIAIQSASNSGGGIIYVPAGVFEVANLAMRNGTAIVGAGKKATTILYNGIGGDYMFESGQGCTGLYGYADFSIRPKNIHVLPDQYFQAGDKWGSGTASDKLRYASYIFCVRVDIDTPLGASDSAYVERDGDVNYYRGIAMVLIMDKHFMLRDCNWSGSQCTLNRAYGNGYLQMHNNQFDFTVGYVVLTASYSTAVDIEMVSHHEHFDALINGNGVTQINGHHGFFHRDRLYLANCTIKDTGVRANDGETICAEPINASYAYGRILSTGITTEYSNTSGDYVGRRYMDLSNDNDIRDITSGVFGKLVLTITSGTGVGQTKHIDENLLGGDFANRVYLDENETDWVVTPDETSTFALMHSVAHVVLYNNRAYDSTKGILMYGNYYDSVAAGNYFEETEGICVWGAEVRSANRFNPNFRILVTNNIMKGTGKTGVGGIGITFNWNTGNIHNFNTQSYHVEFRDNYIYGDKVNRYDSDGNVVPRRVNALSEAWLTDGYYATATANSTDNKYTVGYLPKLHNVLYTNNYTENTRNGVYIGSTHISGIYVHNTTYVNVDYPHAYVPNANDAATLTNIVYDGDTIYATRADFDAALAGGRYVDVLKPFWSTGRVYLSRFSDTMAFIEWDEAHDNIGVSAYDVYINGEYYTSQSSRNLLITGKNVTYVEIYCRDTAGNQSITPIVAGDNLIVNLASSVGFIAQTVTNRFEVRTEMQLLNAVDKVVFTISYDRNAYEYISSTLNVDGTMTVDTSVRGKITYVINLTGDYAGDYMRVVTTAFKVRNHSGLVVGNVANFSLSGVSVKAGESAYALSLVNGGVLSIEIVDKVKALDLTLDGKVNTQDYNAVLGQLGVKKTDDAWISAARCDINGDGVIDINDLMIVYYNMEKYD